VAIAAPLLRAVEGAIAVDRATPSGLRVEEALRHDPDVVIAGEVASPGDAILLARAAASGTCVLASVVASSAGGAVAGLRARGVDPFLLAAAPPTLVAIRSARALCASCREPDPAPPASLQEFGVTEADVEAASIYRAVGCARCASGYRGTFALAEAIASSADVRSAIHEGHVGAALDARLGAPRLSLRQCAIRAVARGRTSIVEGARALAAS
jgi:type IV pilus assembly protein PilB